jgi:drug/metabolite transporter (DMT)-like permease
MRDVKGYLMIMAAASFWGCSATAAKLLLNQHVDTILIVQTRVTFSALLLLLFYLLFKPNILRVKLNDLWRFALLGVLGVAGSNFTYYFTIKESTVATAIILQYAAPLLVMAYTTLVGEERFTTLKLVAAVVSLAGCFLAVGAYDTSALKLSGAGLMSGIGSMLSFAFLNIYTRHVLQRYNVWTMTFYAIAFASLFWLIVNPPWTLIAQSPSSGAWGGLAVLAIISILIPHSLYFAGMQYVVASRAIITSTLEPVIAMMSAALFLAELLQPLQLVGTVLVIGAIVLLQLRKEEETIKGSITVHNANVA